jgi:uncharacterized protein (DUF2141 family)
MSRFLLLVLGCGLAACAADLTVQVTGITAEKGEVLCALFGSPEGFPMQGAKARTTSLKAKPGTVECKFASIPAGTYAVAVSIDTNGNGKTDTGVFGIPKEAWGVSNNARPKMRAPKFEEAAFAVKDGETKPIEVKVAQ